MTGVVAAAGKPKKKKVDESQLTAEERDRRRVQRELRVRAIPSVPM